MALHLDRDYGEAIVIARNIHIQVLRGEDRDVELVINAPRDVPVDREEIHWDKMANGGHEHVEDEHIEDAPREGHRSDRREHSPLHNRPWRPLDRRRWA